MSKVALTGNNSGTGTFTIAAPNSNTDRTFDLPDEAGTVVTTATDLEPQVKDSLNATGDAPIYACRVWVNFDPSTASINGSGNVSSLVEIVDGFYDVNFTTSMVDMSYSVIVSAKINNSNQLYSGYNIVSDQKFQFRLYNGSSSSSGDIDQATAAVFR